MLYLYKNYVKTFIFLAQHTNVLESVVRTSRSSTGAILARLIYVSESMRTELLEIHAKSNENTSFGSEVISAFPGEHPVRATRFLTAQSVRFLVKPSVKLFWKVWAMYLFNKLRNT